MTEATATTSGLTFRFALASKELHPFDEVAWELRDAVIHDSKGNVVFSQKNVRVPTGWSQTATNIVASKYLHGLVGTDQREAGVDSLIHRVVSTITAWGGEDGYFQSPEDLAIFERELSALLVGQYPNGQPGELFLRMAKEGSTIAGLMECFGTAVSVGLQHGVPLKVLCEKFSHTRFEPSGWTGNEEMGYAKSIMDYIFRWIDARFLSGAQLPLFRGQGAVDAGEHLEGSPAEQRATRVPNSVRPTATMGDAPACSSCGAIMERSGSCYRCPECGGTSGCS